MKPIVPLLAIVSLVLLFAGCKPSGSASGQKYHCPMHPTYVSDRPGDCPICNMKLVLIKEGAPSAAPSKLNKGEHVKVGQFYCPMDLNVVSNAPGICPECDMKLVERKAGDAEPAPPPGRVAIMIAPEKQQLIGLRTAIVATQHLAYTIRATGTLQHDETKFARMAPRFAGWVKKLHVNFTGQEVTQGEPLFTVFSPELLAAENEYLIARRSLEAASQGAPPAQRDTAKALLESSRRRLQLWEVGNEEIQKLEQRGTPSDEMLFRAPFTGHVLAKNAVEGKSFMAGETLYEMAILHRLWVRASIYETDLGNVRVGQKARVVLPYLNKSLDSAITFLYPHIDPQTRRAEIRLELDNPNHDLRPDMWVNVELEVNLGNVLAVPASAVIDTGARFVAFVKGDDDHLRPRDVKIGTRTDDWWEVKSGLAPGDKVITRALFLVDSESQLKAAIAGMGGNSEHQH